MLSQIGINFEVVKSDIEEVIDHHINPEQVAMELSRQKCMDVVSKIEGDSIVVAADTIVIKDAKILGKPRDEKDAQDMLNMLNGQWHEVITGICLYKTSASKAILDYELTKVKMAEKSDDFIKWYIGTREPFDKAGAYGIQGFGSMLVERIEGCFFNVMGLPINKLCTKLDELGYSWL